jgi:hypothetical protein
MNKPFSKNRKTADNKRNYSIDIVGVGAAMVSAAIILDLANNYSEVEGVRNTITAKLLGLGNDINPAKREKIIEEAKVKPKLQGEKEAVSKYGGHIIDMSELEVLKEQEIKTKLYVRCPKETDNMRMVLYFHGNGGQLYNGNNVPTYNALNAIKEFEEEGDNVAFVMPNDGWPGTGQSKAQNKINNMAGDLGLKGGSSEVPKYNWTDHEDSEFNQVMIDTAEQICKSRAELITVAFYSGGYIGAGKFLDASGKSRRIDHLASFDGIDGRIDEPFIEVMKRNSNLELDCDYNTSQTGKVTYRDGCKRFRKKAKEAGVSSKRINMESNGTPQHSIMPKHAEKYLAPPE